jgi:hypothetical protein
MKPTSAAVQDAIRCDEELRSSATIGRTHEEVTLAARRAMAIVGKTSFL